MQLALMVMVIGVVSLTLYLFLEKAKESKKRKKSKENVEQISNTNTGKMQKGICENQSSSISSDRNTNVEAANNQALIDYDIYIMSNKERSFYICLAAAFLFFIAYVFYKSMLISVLVVPFAIFYPKMRNKDIVKKRKTELSLQFKEALYALSSSLIAGRSIESAFKEALKDLTLIYPDPNAYIIKEFEYITRRIEMNEPIEDVLNDFAGRAHLEDIDNFVDVFIIGKRTGGNIIEIIKNTSNIIGDKLNIKQEIDTLLAERKFEQKVLNIMPIAMILLLTWTTGDYMAPVFETFAGRIAMTVAVLLLGLAYFISKKIISIEV